MYRPNGVTAEINMISRKYSFLEELVDKLVQHHDFKSEESRTECMEVPCQACQEQLKNVKKMNKVFVRNGPVKQQIKQLCEWNCILKQCASKSEVERWCHLEEELKRKHDEIQMESQKLKAERRQIQKEWRSLNAERIKVNLLKKHKKDEHQRKMSTKKSNDPLKAELSSLMNEHALQCQKEKMLSGVIEVKRALETEREKLKEEAQRLGQWKHEIMRGKAESKKDGGDKTHSDDVVKKMTVDKTHSDEDEQPDDFLKEKLNSAAFNAPFIRKDPEKAFEQHEKVKFLLKKLDY